MRLTLAAVVVVAIWIAGLVSAILFGVVTQPKAPRTVVERDLVVYRETVQSGTADTKTWAHYIDVLITAGQLSEANTVINSTLSEAKADRSFVLAERARLRLVERDFAQAVVSADEAIAAAEKEHDAEISANESGAAARDVPLPESWGLAILTKASALTEAGDHAAAVKAYDSYLADNPTDSEVLVRRGDQKAAAGDTSGATSDYQNALEYVPDFVPALDGLKKIGAGAR
jgi:tetratricopeptide (TPR) repeat protein